MHEGKQQGKDEHMQKVSAKASTTAQESKARRVKKVVRPGRIKRGATSKCRKQVQERRRGPGLHPGVQDI
jgi:hypothetical protein